MNKMDEIIIVAPHTKVFAEGLLSFQGAVPSSMWVTTEIMENINDTYTEMRRGDAEENTDFKQPIPYAVIKRGNEVFIYERLKGAGESRLHNKLSLGIGGHMNAVEGFNNFEELLTENLWRELEEELEISDTIFEVDIIGLINDDSDEVGRVHLGILAVIEVHEDVTVQVRETEELDGKFITIDELRKQEIYDRLENWSQIVVTLL